MLTDKRSGSDPGADFDESRDSGEAAFERMDPAGTPPGSAGEGGGTTAAAAPERETSPSAAPDSTASTPTEAVPAARREESVRTEEAAARETAPRHARSEAAAAPESAAAHHVEPAPTGALNVRPPEEEVRRRRDERDAVARSKPVGPRIVQVLMAILLPFLLLIAAVRVVASPVFLWIEYFRPGFPGDGYGFSADDRLTYGSYAVDYLANLSGARYLGDLVFPSGDHLFTAGEVSHMADVKLVVLSAYGAGIAILLFFVLSFLGLRKSKGAFARGLFAGAFVTIGLILALGVLAVLGWQQFFTEFHRIFFAAGTWTFRLEDTLIRLFPGQFWTDSAVTVGVLVMLAASLLVIFCWPTPRRRAAREAQTE